MASKAVRQEHLKVDSRPGRWSVLPNAMNVLITGGCGFIGSNLVHHLRARRPDWTVVTLDKLTYAGNLENLAALEGDPKHVFVRGDICNRELIDHVVGLYRIEAVLHLAAESHVDRSILGPEVFVQTNVLGTQVLLEACKAIGVRRFVMVSTDEVYGSLGADRCVHRDVAASALEPVFGVEGRRRPHRAGLRPHLRAGRRGHAVLEQLRPLTSSRRS